MLFVQLSRAVNPLYRLTTTLHPRKKTSREFSIQKGNPLNFAMNYDLTKRPEVFDVFVEGGSSSSRSKVQALSPTPSESRPLLLYWGGEFLPWIRVDHLEDLRFSSGGGLLDLGLGLGNLLVPGSHLGSVGVGISPKKGGPCASRPGIGGGRCHQKRPVQPPILTIPSSLRCLLLSLLGFWE